MKKNFKFNILDAFIILFVVCVVVVVCFKATGTNVITNSGKFSKTEVVIKLDSMRDFTANALPDKGAEIVINDSGKVFGTIIDKKSEPAKANQLLADGTTIRTTIPERFDVYLTVEVEGIQLDDGYYVNGTQYISVGSANAYRSNGSVFYGTVYKIKD